MQGDKEWACPNREKVCGGQRPQESVREGETALCRREEGEPQAGKDQITWCVQVLRSPKEAFATAMQSRRERCEKCVCLQGDYIKKLLHFQLPVVSSFFK